MRLRVSSRLVVLIALMAALGNALTLTLPIPLAPGIIMHFSQAPPLLVAATQGPLAGAVTGALSVLAASYMIASQGSMWNLLFIPIGNAILCGVAGLCARRVPPIAAALLGELAETPWIYLTTWLYIGLPACFVHMIVVKAYAEVFISAVIVQVLVSHRGIRRLLEAR